MSEPVAETAPSKVAKTYSRTLTDGKGNTLLFLSNIRADGTVKSYVTHREVDGAKKLLKTSRGGSSEYPNLAAAKAAVEKAVKSAASQGWSERKAGGGGFKPRPDAFSLSTLPAPKS